MRRASVIKYLVVVVMSRVLSGYYSVLFSTVTALYTSPWTLSALGTTTCRRGGLRFGTARYFRAEQRRFREDGQEELKRSTGGGVRVNSFVGAPAVGKQTKPINRDSAGPSEAYIP